LALRREIGAAGLPENAVRFQFLSQAVQLISEVDGSLGTQLGRFLQALADNATEMPRQLGANTGNVRRIVAKGR
jgi:hypothetical protein